jgi:hypothetical protein
MAVRPGMSDLIGRWRRLVDDTGSAIWTDNEAQQVLDAHRVDFWQEALEVTPRQVAANTVYYTIYKSRHQNLEASTSGTAAWRLYDSQGAAIGTANYSADYMRGILTFAADQAGSARYLDGRSYDLAGAAADGWRERSARVSSYYDVDGDGTRMTRSQWFKHCQAMAEFYDQQAGAVVVTMRRDDLVP